MGATHIMESRPAHRWRTRHILSNPRFSFGRTAKANVCPASGYANNIQDASQIVTTTEVGPGIVHTAKNSGNRESFTYHRNK
ncbi:hypothetical protein [Frankia sp. Cas3]|uniref:hypothetical protein n=1 Tax=Frankia sp. Cas3 TaxID=3073926 RepID=UPI002AD34F65|nr:hypothetical protein [Frankia sp. Cas3]